MNVLQNTFCPFLSHYSNEQGFIAIPCVNKGEGICIFYDKIKCCCKVELLLEKVEQIAKEIKK